MKILTSISNTMYHANTIGLLMVVLLGGALLVGGCKPKYPSCEKDAHCHENEYCVNNLCQQCRDNGDCAEGQACAEGACRDIEGYCQSNEQCGTGQVCRDNVCGPCLSNGDCTDGDVCLDGSCSKPGCHTDEDCPAGLSCVNYNCEGTPTEVAPVACNIEPIYFDFNSADIESQMREILESNYECLKKRNGQITLEGHCDPRGTTEYNMGLGERRAGIVRKVLKSMGLETSQLRVLSKGEEEASGNSEAGWAEDRRVDIE